MEIRELGREDLDAWVSLRAALWPDAESFLTSEDEVYPISPRAHESRGFRVLTRQTIFLKEPADPGPATFRYFAYGSNMLTRRLRERTPSADARGVGRVGGRRLTFDKVSVDGSGKCDLEPSPDPEDRVHGVLFEVAHAELGALDAAEGAGDGYERERVAVVTPVGDVEAVAYVATRKDPALRPYHWYRALVVAGAEEHGLPPAYVDRLRAVESKPDPDEARRARHEALLRVD